MLLELEASGRDEPEDVVVKGENHQKDDEGQADLLGDLHLLEADRFSKNGFKGQKEEMASIEDRDGKEIDHSEVDTEDGHEEGKTHESSFRLLSGQLGDQDRAANRLCRDDPFNQFHDGDDGQFDRTPCLSKPHADGDNGVYLFDHCLL